MLWQYFFVQNLCSCCLPSVYNSGSQPFQFHGPLCWFGWKLRTPLIKSFKILLRNVWLNRPKVVINLVLEILRSNVESWLSVPGFSCALSSSPIKICISFVFFELWSGVNGQFGLSFLTCNERICPIWPSVTVVKQKEYLPILAHGYMSSNKRMYDQFGCINCDNRA